MTRPFRSRQSFRRNLFRKATSARGRIPSRLSPGRSRKSPAKTGSTSGQVSDIAGPIRAGSSLTLKNRTLFSDHANPIELLYNSLEAYSVNKKVVTAHEPDGRKYGSAIIRAHYGGYTYKPHFDSVRLREKRENYAVHQFEHQFAGVLVLQNSTANGRTAQSIMHQCLWGPEVEPHLKAGTFHEYATGNDVASVEVCLEPGDLYFFNTRGIHEVPGVAGDLPRIVLATFIGFSSDRDEIFVWC